MPDVGLPVDKYLNPCTFVSRHVASVVRKSIARIKAQGTEQAHARVKGTSTIITNGAFCR